MQQNVKSEVLLHPVVFTPSATEKQKLANLKGGDWLDLENIKAKVNYLLSD